MNKIIEKVLSRHDKEFTSNGRHVKVVRGLSWWVLNFCNGDIVERTHESAMKRVAEKYIETGAVPRYGRW